MVPDFFYELKQCVILTETKRVKGISFIPAQ